jgi:hypothetical protein
VSALYDAAVAAIDAANADDPTSVTVRGAAHPLAQVHGVLAAEWMADLHPDASDAWLLAARAHHLRRWELARSEYPEGRAGYLRWKRDQRVRHGRDVGVLLTEIGYDDATIVTVQALVRRDSLATDPGAQAVEDVACLVFLETQLAEVAGKLSHDHLVKVLSKSLAKMSPAAKEAAGRIPLTDAQQAILAEAAATA